MDRDNRDDQTISNISFTVKSQNQSYMIEGDESFAPLKILTQ